MYNYKYFSIHRFLFSIEDPLCNKYWPHSTLKYNINIDFKKTPDNLSLRQFVLPNNDSFIDFPVVEISHDSVFYVTKLVRDIAKCRSVKILNLL